VEALLEDLAVGDQATPVPDCTHQRLHAVVNDGPAGALAQQPDQRRAIAIVGLGASRAKLSAGCLVSEGANSRTDPGQRRSSSAT